MHVNIGSYYSYETIYVCMKNVLENSFDKRSLLNMSERERILLMKSTKLRLKN